MFHHPRPDRSGEDSQSPFARPDVDLDQVNLAQFFTESFTPHELKRVIANIKNFDNFLARADELPFDRWLAEARYISEEPRAERFPGAVHVAYRFKVDPNPQEIAGVRVFEGYRFGANFAKNWAKDAPTLCVGASVQVDFIQLEPWSTLTAELAKGVIGGRAVTDWNIKIPIGHEISVSRRVLDGARLELRAAEQPGVNSFGDITSVRFGTAKSLGVFNLPGRVLMWEGRRERRSDIGDLVGSWADCVAADDGERCLRARFRRNGVLGFHDSVTIRNEGTVPFCIYIDPSRG